MDQKLPRRLTALPVALLFGEEWLSVDVVMASSFKTRRVRTGCLTCRDRHLKCDEQKPDCLNCRKSRRRCNRDRRINFDHYTKVQPLQYTARGEWSVISSGFLDESLSIARLYKGGEARYPAAVDDEPVTEGKESRPLAGGFLKNEPSSERPSSFVHKPTFDPIKMPPSSDGSSSTIQLTSRRLALPISAVGTGYGTSSSGLPLRPGSMMSNTNCEDIGSSCRQVLTLADATQPAEVSYSTPFAADADHRRINGNLGREAVHSAPQTLSPLIPSMPPQMETMMDVDAMSNSSSDDDDRRKALRDPEDIRHMSAFIDDMAGWMRAFDDTHILERLFPRRALECQTLLSALLAYGASFTDKDTARRHYETAAWGIRHFNSSNRGNDKLEEEEKGCWCPSFRGAPPTSLQAAASSGEQMIDVTAATVVLYVCEMMLNKLERTSAHSTEAKDMIRRGGWDGSSTGLGGACFWLFVVTDVLTCLAMNWEVSWGPDEWFANMDICPYFVGTEADNNDGGNGGGNGGGDCNGDGNGDDNGNENGNGNGVHSDGHDEIWVRRIFYVLAKVSDFRATGSKFETPDMERVLRERQPQWVRLERLCQAWHGARPFTMRPYAYIKGNSKSVNSCFPLIRFSSNLALIGSLCYHTSRCLLAHTNPSASTDMRRMELHHAQQICGIVATESVGNTEARHPRQPEPVVACSLVIAQAALNDAREVEEAGELMKRNSGFV